MTYNPNVLKVVLKERRLSYAGLSARLGIKQDELERELDREPEPRQGLLNDIATELALPPFVFYMAVAPSLNDVIADFRSANSAPAALERATVESIQLARAVQNLAIRQKVESAAKLPVVSFATREEIEQSALRARKFFGISLEDQVNSRDAKAFYTLSRKKIESRGIFVLQTSFPATDGSGFCLAHDRHPVVVINSQRQTRGRRLFTLIHEIAHVLVGASGISDPFVRLNLLERRCNYFAANFLVPADYVRHLLGNLSPPANPSPEDVARIGRRLKISFQAAVLRLEELGIVAHGSHERWLTAIHNQGNPDYSERGGGSGGPPPQEKVKLARYGFHFARAFTDPLQKGRLTEIDLYRASGLKPSYQRAYFSFANSIVDEQLRDLELDDE